uniref:Uncharacterized protein n=1 Tax=Cyanophora sudae TaxID=1522369 RepID=A0A2Z4HGG4_9EUKA|nr:hypothetical protein [Cyanophora sudae]AWW13743.1 hypothetical protein [Cyanophora sudae]
MLEFSFLTKITFGFTILFLILSIIGNNKRLGNLVFNS